MLELTSDFDSDGYKIALNGLNFVVIKSIVNDVIIRNSFEKDVTKYVKRNTPKIIELANKLYEKKWLKSKEILSIIG